MKAQLIEVGLQKEQTFFIKQLDCDHFNTPFHFHELCELNYVMESSGKRIVGDNISNFSSGDLVLMSSNLPHIWYNDPDYLKDATRGTAKAIVTYFNPNFLVDLTHEEHYRIRITHLLDKARRGIRFLGNTQQHATDRLQSIIHKKGLEKVIDFLDIINLFLDATEYECLASIGYQHSFNEKDTRRMSTVYQYLIQNFTEPISLDEIAAVANLSSPAFCNFFKKRTQKSFSRFLNELRVGHACKLLQNHELSISDVGYQSGYQNMTNFNKFFKDITGTTPSQYRKELNDSFAGGAR
ncbi:MAG: helix-turn-helix domain-containing protein [Bacteroidetes bacterium]|nr:helix-turn-helix domain-containing protein [Bacteroidota bacterium]